MTPAQENRRKAIRIGCVPRTLHRYLPKTKTVLHRRDAIVPHKIARLIPCWFEKKASPAYAGAGETGIPACHITGKMPVPPKYNFLDNTKLWTFSFQKGIVCNSLYRTSNIRLAKLSYKLSWS